MTELDLAAIRARYDTAVGTNGDHYVEGYLKAEDAMTSAHDIPVLLARLTEVEGERDRLKTDTGRLARRLAVRFEETENARTERDSLAANLARIRQQVATLTQERDKAYERRDEAWRQRDYAEAERNGMRAVVEIADALIRLKDGPRDEAYRETKPIAWDLLRDALAAVGFHQDSPSAPLAPPLLPTPADPPWLEEAIEEAWDAYCNLSFADHRDALRAAIRAALPLIAAGVLGEAADEVKAARPVLIDKAVHDDDCGHCAAAAERALRHLDAWLRERAARRVTT